jgi:serine/threonine protein kinase
MREHQHPNILYLVDVFAEYSERTVSLVLELAVEGELFDYISAKKKLSERETRKLFSQLFSALDYLVSPSYPPAELRG